MDFQKLKKKWKFYKDTPLTSASSYGSGPVFIRNMVDYDKFLMWVDDDDAEQLGCTKNQIADVIINTGEAFALLDSMNQRMNEGINIPPRGAYHYLIKVLLYKISEKG